MRYCAGGVERAAVLGDAATALGPWVAPPEPATRRGSPVTRLRTADRAAAEDLFNASYPRLAGWVRRLEHDYNAFIIRGDTTWCHGEVIGKHEQESLAPLVIQPSSCSPSWACAIGPINGCNRGKDSKRKRSETCSAISSSRGCFPPMDSKLLQW